MKFVICTKFQVNRMNCVESRGGVRLNPPLKASCNYFFIYLTYFENAVKCNFRSSILRSLPREIVPARTPPPRRSRIRRMTGFSRACKCHEVCVLRVLQIECRERRTVNSFCYLYRNQEIFESDLNFFIAMGLALGFTFA